MARFFRRRQQTHAEAADAIDQAIEKTRRAWFSRIGGLFQRGALDDALWEELEETLIAADVGVQTAQRLLDSLRERIKRDGLRDSPGALAALKEEMIAILTVETRNSQVEAPLVSSLDSRVAEPRPEVILVVGVNGTGKTTNIGKLAYAYRQEGKRVLLAAADTFRAAAIDQLKQWGQQAGAEVVAHQQGADPGAVVFDALTAAEKRNMDVIIIDTAGRLHTKVNLMEELRKVNRVIQRKDPTAPHEVLLVLDATTGQNALLQAKYFTEAIGVTGILLAKLDGTAKGGVIFAVGDQLHLPVRFVGTGEAPEDLAPFSPREFVEALFA